MSSLGMVEYQQEAVEEKRQGQTPAVVRTGAIRQCSRIVKLVKIIKRNCYLRVKRKIAGQTGVDTTHGMGLGKVSW